MKRITSMLLVLSLVAIVFVGCAGKDSNVTEPIKENEEVETSENEPLVDDTVYKLRTSTNLGEVGTTGLALKYFVDQVNERSGGRIEATANYGSELGSQLEQVEMAQLGDLEMVCAAPGTGLGGWVPELAMYEFPFIFDDNEQYRKVLVDTEDEVTKLVSEYGFTAASGQSQGARNILTLKPINTIEDLAGVKMRGPNVVYTDMFDALGAAGTITGWNDIYTSLQTKVIEGCEASPSALYSMNFHEQAKNMTVTNHIIACTYYFFNTEWLESLPDNLKTIVLESAEDAREYHAKLYDEEDAIALQAMIDEGVNVIELSPEEKAKFVEACSGMLDEYRAKGDNWNAFIDVLLAAKN
ncbi:TRAP transporter substrate-binding protein [Petrocella sp. FN5]|uniref:TRAP transporter substrate-binding protein n=1 Tax=Petrocella sp. FN5 TaxID=3032002 RepID=UPI0023DCC067|nr:TRAP transporter substrate-binding protein [Petrocella sp. FN5]MDF1616848.1 TRAP transporter substrate-binding protein [Petrocella sp. FN5]